MHELTTNGICVDCGDPVLGGAGVTIDAQGGVWHADCRRVFNRKSTGTAVIDAAGTVKRGPGRPRKEVTA